MNYKFRTFEDFDREFKRLSKHYHSLKDDLITLQKELIENPTSGADLGKGLRKVRMTNSFERKREKSWSTSNYLYCHSER